MSENFSINPNFNMNQFDNSINDFNKVFSNSLNQTNREIQDSRAFDEIFNSIFPGPIIFSPLCLITLMLLPKYTHLNSPIATKGSLLNRYITTINTKITVVFIILINISIKSNYSMTPEPTKDTLLQL